jgi:hypothetical protein
VLANPISPQLSVKTVIKSDGKLTKGVFTVDGFTFIQAGHAFLA